MSKKTTAGRTLEEIQKEVEQIRIAAEKKKMENKAKKEKFIEENKHVVYYCKECKEEKTVHDYTLVFRRLDGIPRMECKKCKRNRNRVESLKESVERGY